MSEYIEFSLSKTSKTVPIFAMVYSNYISIDVPGLDESCVNDFTVDVEESAQSWLSTSGFSYIIPTFNNEVIEDAAPHIDAGFSVTENNSEERTGIITISHVGGWSATYTVTQKAGLTADDIPADAYKEIVPGTTPWFSTRNQENFPDYNWDRAEKVLYMTGDCLLKPSASLYVPESWVTGDTIVRCCIEADENSRDIISDWLYDFGGDNGWWTSTDYPGFKHYGFDVGSRYTFEMTTVTHRTVKLTFVLCNYNGETDNYFAIPFRIVQCKKGITKAEFDEIVELYGPSNYDGTMNNLDRFGFEETDTPVTITAEDTYFAGLNNDIVENDNCNIGPVLFTNKTGNGGSSGHIFSWVMPVEFLKLNPVVKITPDSDCISISKTSIVIDEDYDRHEVMISGSIVFNNDSTKHKECKIQCIATVDGQSPIEKALTIIMPRKGSTDEEFAILQSKYYKQDKAFASTPVWNNTISVPASVNSIIDDYLLQNIKVYVPGYDKDSLMAEQFGVMPMNQFYNKDSSWIKILSIIHQYEAGYEDITDDPDHPPYMLVTAKIIKNYTTDERYGYIKVYHDNNGWNRTFKIVQSAGTDDIDVPEFEFETPNVNIDSNGGTYSTRLNITNLSYNDYKYLFDEKDAYISIAGASCTVFLKKDNATGKPYYQIKYNVSKNTDTDTKTFKIIASYYGDREISQGPLSETTMKINVLHSMDTTTEVINTPEIPIMQSEGTVGCAPVDCEHHLTLDVFAITEEDINNKLKVYSNSDWLQIKDIKYVKN